MKKNTPSKASHLIDENSVGILNSDDDIIEVEKKIVYYEAIVEFIDGVIKSIDNRGWDIRNAQDWKKFLAGGY